MMKELYYQRRRTLMSILGLSIGIALLIVLNSLSLAYRQAAQVPLKEIGADITVQRSGDVPKDLAGAVFPCSAVTIRKEEVEKIQKLPGVRGIGTGLLLWVFDPNRAWIVLGIEKDNSIGPSLLRSSVTEGRFLEDGKPEALVEQAYARQFGIKLNDTISVADKKFPVVGFVDASRAAKIAVSECVPTSKRGRGSGRFVERITICFSIRTGRREPPLYQGRPGKDHRPGIRDEGYPWQ